MTENNGLDVIVASVGAACRRPGVADSPAVRVPARPAGTWDVDTGPGCGGPWTPVLANQTHAHGLAGRRRTPELCVAGGSPIVHGTLTALYNSAGAGRTVNTLPLEQYVADTVPGESPSSWAQPGRGGSPGQDWGFQELEAQAVAVAPTCSPTPVATAATPTPAT